MIKFSNMNYQRLHVHATRRGAQKILLSCCSISISFLCICTAYVGIVMSAELTVVQRTASLERLEVSGSWVRVSITVGVNTDCFTDSGPPRELFDSNPSYMCMCMCT